MSIYSVKQEEIIINLGSSHVSASKFSQKKSSQVQLEVFDFIDLSIKNAGEDDWISEMENGLLELSSNNKLKGEANFILPSNVILSKTLRVPKVELDKQKKVIAFELSQKMPFPLDSLIWDFLVIDDDGIEQEIITFAIKPEIVNRLADSIYRCGLVAKRLTPCIAYDYYSLNFCNEDHKDTDELFINFGAKSTNLTFKNNTGFLIRTINLGGSYLTDSLASAFGITQEKAEELKISYSTGELSLREDDPSYSVFESNIESFFHKLNQEISRAIVTYKRLKKGKLPSKLILSGRTIKTKRFVDVLSNTQKLPISYFDPLQKINFSEKIIQENKLLLPFMGSELFGLVSEIFQNKKKNIIVNLLPAKKIKQLKIKKKLPWYVSLLFIISITPLPWYLYLIKLQNSLQENRKLINLESQTISKEITKYSLENNDLHFYQLLNNSVQNNLEKFQVLSGLTYSLQRLLNNLQLMLNSNENKNTWIDQLKFNYSLTNLSQDKNNVKQDKYSPFKSAKLIGRYLVNLTSGTDWENPEDRRLALNNENGLRQDALLNAITSIEQVVKIERKVFSIKGKGDLYNRQFTHFELDILLDLTK